MGKSRDACSALSSCMAVMAGQEDVSIGGGGGGVHENVE